MAWVARAQEAFPLFGCPPSSVALFPSLSLPPPNPSALTSCLIVLEYVVLGDLQTSVAFLLSATPYSSCPSSPPCPSTPPLSPFPQGPRIRRPRGHPNSRGLPPLSHPGAQRVVLPQRSSNAGTRRHRLAACCSSGRQGGGGGARWEAGCGGCGGECAGDAAFAGGKGRELGGGEEGGRGHGRVGRGRGGPGA